MLLTYREVVTGAYGPQKQEVVNRGPKAARASAQDQERPTPCPLDEVGVDRPIRILSQNGYGVAVI
eukprot:225468-Alexandrium_andersonii.AAC.1